jgi:hypothetical protein
LGCYLKLFFKVATDRIISQILPMVGFKEIFIILQEGNLGRIALMR